MKKLAITILSLIYLGSSAGVMIHTHYCMGKIAGRGWGDIQVEKCSECGMDMSGRENNGCCSDKEEFFKNDTDQQIANPVSSVAPLFPGAAPAAFVNESGSDDAASVNGGVFRYHAPPLHHTIPVYILYRDFRI